MAKYIFYQEKNNNSLVVFLSMEQNIFCQDETIADFLSLKNNDKIFLLIGLYRFSSAEHTVIKEGA